MTRLESLGKLISVELRDAALNHYLDIESGFSSAPVNRALYEEVKCLRDSDRLIIRKLITASIDAGIHDFLFALNEKQGGIEVLVDGEGAAELSDGLQGEPFTEDGWFEKYSQHKESGI